MSRYTTPLSKREVITLLLGAGILFVLGFPVREYVYPWLGVPVIGFWGFEPLIVVFGLVFMVLIQFPRFRKSETLFLAVSLPLSVLLTLLGLWSFRS
jgi:hypothetical protein